MWDTGWNEIYSCPSTDGDIGNLLAGSPDLGFNMCPNFHSPGPLIAGEWEGGVSHPHQVGSITHLQPIGLFLELLFPTGVEAPKPPFSPATGILLQTHPTTHTLLSPTYCSNSFAQAPVSVIHRLQGGPWSLQDKQLLASSMSLYPATRCPVSG